MNIVWLFIAVLNIVRTISTQCYISSETKIVIHNHQMVSKQNWT